MLGNIVSSRNFLKWFYIQLPFWFKRVGMKAIPRTMDKVVDGAQWLSVLQAARDPSAWLSFMQTRPSTRFYAVLCMMTSVSRTIVRQ